MAALLTERTVAEAAKRAGIAPRTLERWLAGCPAFRAQYRAARRRALEGAASRLQTASGEAVEALRRNLTCGAPATEIRSAMGLLTLAPRAHEQFELQEELEALRREVTGE